MATKGVKPKNFEYFQSFNRNRLGTRQSDKYKAHMSEIMKSMGNMPPHPAGSKHWNWKGGKTELLQSIRTSKRNIEWRNGVYARDGYKCTICGDTRGHNLNADHIIPLSVLVEKHGIKMRMQAIECEALFDLKNGRTLCHDCHKKTNTWGSNSKKFVRERKGLTFAE